MAPTIRATFGLRGSSSSASAALQSSLVSKLRARMALDGSTVFRLTWKQRTTPSGRLIWALRASARSTSDNASGSWPSPTANNYEQRDELAAAERRARLKAKHGNGNGFGLTLGNAARLASWPSPVVNDAKGSDYAYSQGNHDRPVLKLGGVAKLAHWQTPRGEISGDTPETHEARQTRVVAKHGRRMGTPLEVQAGWAYWHTPVVRDHRNSAGDGTNPRDLPRQVSGVMPTGSTAETGKPGQLNPELSRWLQGFPSAWTLAAPLQARAARGSSGPTGTP